MSKFQAGEFVVTPKGTGVVTALIPENDLRDAVVAVELDGYPTDFRTLFVEGEVRSCDK